MTDPSSTTTDLASPSPTTCCTELENFVQIFQRIRPRLPGITIGEVEIYGDSVFLNGSAGGDHLIYLQFDERYDLSRRMAAAREAGSDDIVRKLAENCNRIGVLVADVSGHRVTDALVAAMLHQAFLTGVLYELDQFGEVTTRLFENLNTRFSRSLSIEKYVTMVYGEISATGRFRFLSAGSPDPMIFSAEFDSFVNIAKDRLVGVYPLGMFPSEDDVDLSKNLEAFRYKPSYTVNEVNLMGVGDILLLLTDGYADHARNDDSPFTPAVLESTLRTVKHLPARAIYEAVLDRALSFAPATDDMTMVVIKRVGRKLES
jgi:serine phosphatase RsbU (regulator of sigma subunit)